MKSTDQFLGRVRSDNYDCLDFACEVWKYLVENDNRLEQFRDLRSKNVQLLPSIIKQFIKLENPLSPCIVVMHRPGENPHIGIYYDNRILHLPSGCVRSDLPLVAKGYFSELDYYK